MSKGLTKEVYIKTLEELKRKRWYIFGCIIHMPYEEFAKMPEQLAKEIICQMNSFEAEK